MRIAYVCADPGVPVFGQKGCSIHVQEVVGALRHTGADVSLYATSLGGRPPRALVDIPIRRLPSHSSRDKRVQEWEGLQANYALREALKASGRFDAIYERYSLWSFAGMEFAKEAGAAGLLEVNAPLVEEEAAHRGLVDRKTAEAVADRAFAAASRLIVVSEPLARWMNQRPSARGRVQVIPNAIDPGRFPANFPATHRVPGVFTVGFLGGLRPWHGLTLLAEAFADFHARWPASRLLVVGDGPERGALEAALSARGVRQVSMLTGAVAPHEVPGLLASMDVAVAPYGPQPQFYFSPLKIYEYMAAGLPVVASRIGQVAEVIRHGESGLLCAPGDAASMAESLARLAADPSLRERLRTHARRRVLTHNTWRSVAEHILRLASESLQERRNRTATTAVGSP